MYNLNNNFSCWKNLFLFCYLFFALGYHAPAVCGNSIEVGTWSVRFMESDKTVSFLKDNKTILQGIAVKAKVDYREIYSNEYTNVSFSTNSVADEVGAAQKYIIEYSESGKPTIQQIFYLYEDKDYFLTEVVLSSATKIQTNYLSPIYSTVQNNVLPQSADNRLLTIPYDNDGFITYGAFSLTVDTISFEVTSVFNGSSQNGLVIGSVEHDTWKSAIRMKSSENKNLDYLECYNGATHQVTRDEITWEEGQQKYSYLMPHGSLRDNNLNSSRFLVGFFKDWRTGMETYGEVNEKIAPKRTWDKGVPFGWNSWGGMSTHVNYKGVISVSDFMKENLQSNNFSNDNTVYVSLDSYWDNLNENELRSFADHCYANGQIPGIYWTPFCDWFGWSRGMEGSTYNYSDTWIKANGKDRSLCGAKCLDPTHPGTIARMKYFVDKFKSMGFKYIKLDFMTNGTVEADYYYDRYTTTGLQAYNYGMQKFVEFCGDDMFIVLSISPLFPANYAHARRISCDAWGEMWHTQYMMNSLSYGWWLDRVYVFNDADHLVMGDRSDGENRARMTSGAITGLYMLGDNLSTDGNYIGTEISQEKTKKMATNSYINEIARLKKSFRPAYGHKQSSSSGAVDLFTYETDTHYYIAYFNYGGELKAGYLDLESLGMNAANVSEGKECWMKMAATIEDGKLRYSIPAGDARMYMLTKIETSSLEEHQTESSFSLWINGKDDIIIKSGELFSEVDIFSISGIRLVTKRNINSFEYNVPASQLSKGIYLITVTTATGKKICRKFSY